MTQPETTAPNFAQDGMVVNGLESLGKGILDAAGRPSGSPANWENTWGVSSEPGPLTPEEQQGELSAILAELNPEQ